jgi:hypothetical protein
MRHFLKRFLGLAVVCSLNLAAAAGADYCVTAVEETWELAVGEPNLLRNAPQVTMSMLPEGHSDGDYFMFTLNFKAAPAYYAGGMQVSLWNGENLVHYRNGPKEGQINVANETVVWTQRLSVDGGESTFEIVGGDSQTWETFGGQGYLRTCASTNLTNLNAYSPFRSMEESGISFAGNRVSSLTLKQVKWEFSDGRTYTATAPFDIDNDELDPWKH